MAAHPFNDRQRAAIDEAVQGRVASAPRIATALASLTIDPAAPDLMRQRLVLATAIAELELSTLLDRLLLGELAYVEYEGLADAARGRLDAVREQVEAAFEAPNEHRQEARS